jgi:hypothetical protein
MLAMQLERSRSCRQLCVSYPFYERTGPRHATDSSLFTSKPLRPPSAINYRHYLNFRKGLRHRGAQANSQIFEDK